MNTSVIDLRENQAIADKLREAEAGSLPTIAPKRFNPEGKAWLPALHTRRRRTIRPRRPSSIRLGRSSLVNLAPTRLDMP
ncbi:MAG: hypothetical protein A3G24_22370 [Betaproteobacteria bacterium RIFCSPLOWO2_12_FULL_62_13]|nr:MAG: hypothetical protein A3G24_22370 [Betaproteobacteria bacterium RIFCSPLOWO2_12_FULL_62_13]